MACGGRLTVVVSPEQVFAVHPKIRWVGMVTMKGSILLSEMRPGVERVTTEEEDRLMLELQAPFHREMNNRRGKLSGPVGFAVVSFQAFYELHVPVGEYLVVVAVENDIPFAQLQEITRKIKGLLQ